MIHERGYTKLVKQVDVIFLVNNNNSKGYNSQRIDQINVYIWSEANCSYLLGYSLSWGMQVLQCRYCNTSGSLTLLPCRVVNHCLVVQVLVRTEG